MSEVSGVDLRGFLLHDPAISLGSLAALALAPGATDSDYSEADPRPGIAVASDPLGTHIVRAHNGQDADLRVRVVRPGLPAIDGSGTLYREELDSGDEAYRGWNEPNHLEGFYSIAWTSTEEWRASSAVTIPSTQKVVVFATDILSNEVPSTWTWDPVSRTFGDRVDLSGDVAHDAVCGVCLQGTERVLAFYLEKADGTLLAKYSDDAGATWTQYGRDATAGGAGSIDTSIDEISAIEDRSGALLLLGADTGTGTIYLYRSIDGGATFAESETVAAFGSRPRLARLADGRILLAYREQTTIDPKVIVLDDAYDTLSSKTGIALNSTNNAEYVAPFVDSDGIAYVYITQAIGGTGDDDQVLLTRSIDGGATWTSYGHNAISNQDGAGLATDYMSHVLCAAPSGGEVLGFGKTLNADSSPATDGSLAAWLFGGWSTLEQRGAARRTTRRSYGGIGTNDAAVFVPSDTLGNMGWTVSGTTHSVLDGAWRFLTAASACYAEYSTLAALGTSDSQVVAEFQIASATAATGILYYQRGTRAVRIYADTDGFSAYDVGAGAAFGSTVPIDMSLANDPVQIRIVWEGSANNVTIFYKRRSSSIWIKAQQKASVSGGLASVDQRFRLGVLTGTPTADVRCRWLAKADHSPLNDIADDTGFVSDLSWGKALGTRPYPVRDQGTAARMLHLSVAGGPSRHAESWQIPAEHDHPVSAIFPQDSPGPDARWRTLDTSEQRLVWDLTGAGRDGRLGTGPLVALALIATNFRTAVLEYRVAGGGSNVTIGTWDAALETGLTFARDSASTLVGPGATGKAAAAFWRAGQLSGGTIIFDPSGTPVARRIRWNSPGGWYPGSLFPPTLEIDGIDGTEPTSGTCDVIAPGGALLVPLSGVVDYRRVQLRIPAQDTAEGYFELGNLILGSVLVPGRQWSRGYSWRISPRVTLEEDDRGVVWPDRRGPEVRELTVSWQDAGDLSRIRRGPAAPHVSAYPGGPGIAARQDVHWQLEAMLRLTRGGSLPVVALPDCSGGSARMVLDQDMWLYGLAQGRPQANHVLGSDGISEVFRNESITIREQPWTRWEL